MEAFPCYWPFVRGIHRSQVNSPHKGQWRGALMFSLIDAWTNGWVNNRDAGSFRSHLAHYDVTVMMTYVYSTYFYNVQHGLIHIWLSILSVIAYRCLALTVVGMDTKKFKPKSLGFETSKCGGNTSDFFSRKETKIPRSGFAGLSANSKHWGTLHHLSRNSRTFTSLGFPEITLHRKHTSTTNIP